MAYIHEKISPVTESLMIWNRLYLIKGNDKSEVIFDLYMEGLLSKPGYTVGCPLCAAFSCRTCPWPGFDKYAWIAQCCKSPPNGKGLFKVWCCAGTVEAKAKAALAIYELLRNIDDFPEGENE